MDPSAGAGKHRLGEKGESARRYDPSRSASSVDARSFQFVFFSSMSEGHFRHPFSSPLLPPLFTPPPPPPPPPTTTTTMAASFSVALVPLAPLVALPPRLVAAAASCACLIGGAALGVARVRAGEPRAAEAATATFAAVGASLAVSAWWLLASGGVGNVKNSDERGGGGKWGGRRRKEALRGAVNSGSSGGDGDGAPPPSSSSSSSSSSSKQRQQQQRPLALAARFASVPWKAAQRASKAGNALCPFTGGGRGTLLFEGSLTKRVAENGYFLLFLRVPLGQKKTKKTKKQESAPPCAAPAAGPQSPRTPGTPGTGSAG